MNPQPPQPITIDPNEDLTPEKSLMILMEGCKQLTVNWQTHMVFAKAGKTLDNLIKSSQVKINS